jgi:predicted DNA-binding transcriptional regulator AlpA
MEKKSVALSELPSFGYVRQAQLIPAIVPFSAATLWRKVQSGDFPEPVKLSSRITAWRVEDVRNWMDARTNAVRTSPIKRASAKTHSPTSPH